MDTSKLNVPMAIIIAGVIVGGAIIYTSKSNSNPTPANGAQQVAAKAQVHDIVLSAVTADDHIIGNVNAPVALIEFSDLECPFCKSFHGETLKPMMQAYTDSGKVAWVYRHFPLNRHPKAPHEAEAAECAAEQGGNDAFWKYIGRVFEITPSNNGLEETELPKVASYVGLDVSKFNTCLASGKYKAKVTAQMNEGIKAGGNGTPFTIFLLKNKIGQEAAKYITDANTGILNQINQPGTEDFIYVSTDGMKVGMSGAMSPDLVKGIIDRLVAGK